MATEAVHCDWCNESLVSPKPRGCVNPEHEPPAVCIAHGRFIPCRKNGEHRYTDNPYWVKSVRDYQSSPIADPTWEPAP